MRLLALLLCLSLAAPAWAGKVALVLGNARYAHAEPLRNAANDARDMAQRLRGMEFQVYEGIDLTRRQTLELVQQVARALRTEDTALFFFAGHRMQLGSDNYILPVDATPGTEADLTASAVRLQAILTTMERAAETRIVILDACRNNPFLNGGLARSADARRRLMRMEAGVGSFIAFSTEPGNVAADGNDRNSPFTAALLRHIDTPGADIHAVMRAVRADVMDASNNTQVPWENSSLLDEVYLAAALRPSGQTRMVRPEGAIILPTPPRHATRLTRPGEVCREARFRDAALRYCASSVLKAQGANSYGVENLFDRDPATAWVEGTPGLGEGEQLSYDFDREISISRLHILNGYTKSESTFTRNARPAELILRASTGAEARLSLSRASDWQSFDLSGFDRIRWLQIEIARVYPGSRWEDTCISEIAFE